MVQVAFDTQEFVDTLEKEGLPRNQAKAISLVVRKSHEIADLATKRDLDDIRKDIDARFDKTDAKIADVRKDLSAEISMVKRDIEDVRKDLSTEISLVRKDMEALTNSLLIKMAAMMAGIVSLAAAFIKFF